MADREWYRVPGMGKYTNTETAASAAEELAGRTDDEVELILCTESVVRVYKRQVTVASEDVSSRKLGSVPDPA